MSRLRALLLVALCLVAALPVAAQQATPAPPPLPTQEMFQQMATANASINTLPGDLTRPQGLPVVPNERGQQLFGYVKWLVSPASADEWAGPLAPPFYHAGVGLWMMFGLMSVYVAVYIIGNVGGWLAWLLDQARKALDLVFQALQAAPLVLVLVVILVVAYALLGEAAVTEWLEQQLTGVIEWIYRLVSQLSGGAI